MLIQTLYDDFRYISDQGNDVQIRVEALSANHSGQQRTIVNPAQVSRLEPNKRDHWNTDESQNQE